MGIQIVKKGHRAERSAAEFNEIARTIFLPVYPVIARQAVACCGFDRGFCIDAGCGPGHLALALAAVSGFRIDALDTSTEMLACARKNIQNAGMSGRIRTVQGDVHALPYADCSADLVMSRGSIFFWESPAKAFREIYRVLKPGGRSFVGGGFGSPELKAAIIATMRESDPSWEEMMMQNMGRTKDAEIRQALNEACITDAEIRRDDSGFWVVMRK